MAGADESGTEPAGLPWCALAKLCSPLHRYLPRHRYDRRPIIERALLLRHCRSKLL